MTYKNLSFFYGSGISASIEESTIFIQRFITLKTKWREKKYGQEIIICIV